MYYYSFKPCPREAMHTEFYMVHILKILSWNDNGLRVFQKINYPKSLIASETKCSVAISKSLRLLLLSPDAARTLGLPSGRFAFRVLRFGQLGIFLLGVL